MKEPKNNNKSNKMSRIDKDGDDSVTSNASQSSWGASSTTTETNNTKDIVSSSTSSGMTKWVLIFFVGLLFFVVKGLGKASAVSGIMSRRSFQEQDVVDHHEHEVAVPTKTQGLPAMKAKTTKVKSTAASTNTSTKQSRRKLMMGMGMGRGRRGDQLFINGGLRTNVRNTDGPNQLTRVRTNINVFQPGLGFLPAGDPNRIILAPGARQMMGMMMGGGRSSRSFDPPVLPPIQSLPPLVCGSDTFLCEDRTIVFRNIDNNCEFDPCPVAGVCPLDVRQCPDGSVLVRDPLQNCEFPVCPEVPGTVVCPLDVFQCPDGTSVGRIPPDCNFQDCPAAACPTDVAPCPDGSFVVRDPLDDCEFMTCPSGQCPLDTRLCPGGTTVSRVLPECNFEDCPNAVCTTDIATCPDGSTVVRDPTNDCRFMTCPNSACPSDILTCPDGSTVVRDPTDNCEFPLCPNNACPADIQTCPDGSTVIRIPPDCLFEKCPNAICPGDVLTCPGGSVVVRDPLNDCEFEECPNQVTVSTRLDYGFFAGTILREPTSGEYTGLQVESSRFYTDTLRQSFSNLNTAIAVRTGGAFVPGNTNFPVMVNFNLIAFFNDGTTPPSQAQIIAAINAANYITYVSSYVRNAQPTGTIFFDTQNAIPVTAVPL